MDKKEKRAVQKPLRPQNREKNETRQEVVGNEALNALQVRQLQGTVGNQGIGRMLANQPPVQKKPNSTGLPDNLKSGVEQLSGVSLDDVRIHRNSDKPASVQAVAFAQGSDIHVAPGQEQHLPHETWHVAQQKQGRVQPTTTVNGVAVNDNPRLEREATEMGAKATQLQPVAFPLPAPANGLETTALQRMKLGGTELSKMKDSDILKFLGKQKSLESYLRGLSANDMQELRSRMELVKAKSKTDGTIVDDFWAASDKLSAPTNAGAASSGSEKATKRREKKKEKQESRIEEMKAVSKPGDVGFGHAAGKHAGYLENDLKRRAANASNKMAGQFTDIDAVCDLVRAEAFRFLVAKQHAYRNGTLRPNESYDTTVEVDATVATIIREDGTKLPGPFRVRLVVKAGSLESGDILTMYPILKTDGGATNSSESIAAEFAAAQGDEKVEETSVAVTVTEAEKGGDEDDNDK